MNASRELRSTSASPASAPARSRLLSRLRNCARFVTRHWLSLSATSIAILAYTIFGFYFVPRIARAQLQDYVAGTLQQQLSIGEVRFNPFTFDASVSALKLTGRDGSVLVAFRQLYLDAELASLWQRAIVLDEVQLSAPDIRVVIASDASVNLAALLVRSEASSASAPPRVRIGQLAVREGRISVDDRMHAKPFKAVIAPIRFTLTDFKTDVGHRNVYHFAGTTAAGEALEWSGGFTVKPFGSQGEFKVERMQATTIDTYLQESLPFALSSGVMTLSGTYRFGLEPLTLDVALPTVAASGMLITERMPSAGNANGERASIELPEIAVDGVVFAYATRNVAVRRLDIKRARVDVRREANGSINVARLLTPTGSNVEAQTVPDTPAPLPDSAPLPLARDSSEWNVRIDTIHIDQAALVAEDWTVTPTAKLEIAPASLTVTGWTTADDAALDIDADLRIGDRGKLRTSGTVKLEPVDAVLAVDLGAFDLTSVQPYVREIAALTLHSGRLSAQGDFAISLPPETAGSFTFDGNLEIDDLRTTDNLVNEDLLRWRRLTVSELHLDPKSLTIDQVVARQPYASVVIADDATLNVSRLIERGDLGSRMTGREITPSRAPLPDVHPTTARPPPHGARSGPSLDIRIRSVQVVDGSAHFADYSIRPSFDAAILGLNGHVTGLSSAPASRAKVKLEGNVDKYAPVEITGEINLLSAAKYSDIAMNFRNMELTTFNPYSGKFAGYNISKGKLSTELKYRVEDRKLDAQHHIVLDNLEFGARTDSKDAAPIPIKLAIALLKDRNGVIDLQLPVGGSLDDPTFRLGPIIWKAFLGLLTKIVTAPFAAIGALFGGGEELAYVDFPAGSAELGPAEAEKLGKLVQALAERPQLRLDVPLTLAANEDSEALATRALAQRIPAALDETDEDARRARMSQLEALYKSLSKTPPQYPPETESESGIDWSARLGWLETQLLERLRPDQSAIDALARQRAQAVQTTVLANADVSPERVFITTDRRAELTPAGTVRMNMKLE